MNETKLSKTAVFSYVIIVILFAAFFLYMCFCEEESVYNVREAESYGVIKNYTETVVEDPDLPAGMYREFTWNIQSSGQFDTVLAFYVVHSNVKVYFDNELMYRLARSEDGIIGKSAASNWVIVPVYTDDTGKEVRVEITPVYRSVKNRNIEFLTGSLNSILHSLLRNEFYSIVAAGLCIILGLLIMGVWIIMVRLKKVREWDIFYLGNFSVFLGIWKITDTRLSVFVFENHSMALGYITIGVLFLACIPFILYIKGASPERSAGHVIVCELIAVAVAGAALFLQVLGVLDLKQTLPLAHGVVIMTICLAVITAYRREKSMRNESVRKTWLLVFIPAAGVA
ncbi:MAG: hypothetical protein Q4C14_04300, partial [Bacillota bacterium]|nr:hypothetical protein [Bacillota bacterium]